MHFALRGYLFIALTALLGVAGHVVGRAGIRGRLAAAGVPVAAGPGDRGLVPARHAGDAAMRYDDRLKLGRQVPGAFAFAHNRGREIVLQYARVLPPALRQTTEVRRVALPPEEETAAIRRNSCRCASAPAGSATCRRGC